MLPAVLAGHSLERASCHALQPSARGALAPHSELVKLPADQEVAMVKPLPSFPMRKGDMVVSKCEG